MDLKILDGRKVAHKVFGVGKIVDADERLISIDFGGCIKKFDFRSVEKFINFENDETVVVNESKLNLSKFISSFLGEKK